MGFFTSSKDTKKKSARYPDLPSRPSLTDPPNIYYTSSSRPPKRPVTATAIATPTATSLQLPATAHAQTAQATCSSQHLLPPPIVSLPFYAQPLHANHSQPLLQPQPAALPAGYLPPPLPPPPPGWLPGPAPAPQQQQQHGYPHPHQPMIVNQHYYNYVGASASQLIHPHPPPFYPTLPGSWPPHHQPQHHVSQPHLHNDTNNYPSTASQDHSGRSEPPASTSSAAYDEISSRFDNLMTMIDQDHIPSNEDLFACCQPPTTTATTQPQYHPNSSAAEDLTTDRSLGINHSSRRPPRKSNPNNSQTQTSLAASVVSGNYFSKVELYANSKLPTTLPPLALYMPTWPLLCLAAQYSLRVYDPLPSSSSPSSSPSSHRNRNSQVFTAGWRTGHKALLIKSLPLDRSSTILLSIRGTASFADWAINLNTSPSPPTNFLDDPGNYCHAGFLSLARGLIKPVAERLRQLLEEEPSRVSSFSLLLTGHSAGGAVAALLYSHMLSTGTGAQSELNALTGCFKRIHCVTFGAPPVSLLPLEKPDRPELRKSLFLSFVNEGDPVVRADKPYVKSLLELLASPPPPLAMSSSSSSSSPPSPPLPSRKDSKDNGSSNFKKHIKSKSLPSLKVEASKYHPFSSSLLPLPLPPRKPHWKVPPSTLSNAGRIVILRSADPSPKPSDHKSIGERLAEGVAAVTCREEHLRGVIWGDPVAHTMSLYAGRIEALAVEAVTAMTGMEAAREAELSKNKKPVNTKEGKRRLWGLVRH